MTAAEFDALARLLQGQGGAGREGARRHLVDGLSVAQASREAGVTHASVAHIVSRLRQLQHSGCPTCHQPVWE